MGKWKLVELSLLQSMPGGKKCVKHMQRPNKMENICLYGTRPLSSINLDKCDAQLKLISVLGW